VPHSSASVDDANQDRLPVVPLGGVGRRVATSVGGRRVERLVEAGDFGQIGGHTTRARLTDSSRLGYNMERRRTEEGDAGGMGDRMAYHRVGCSR